MRRHGTTLIELLVVLGVMAVFGTMAWGMFLDGNRQARNLEGGTDLVRAALALEESLSRDLAAALPLDVLPPELWTRGEARGELVLPLFREYAASEAEALTQRRVRYSWDPTRRRVLRDDVPVTAAPLGAARFRWSETRPTRLVVELEGEAAGAAGGGRMELQLPAPERTDAMAAWVFAEHHRGVAGE